MVNIKLITKMVFLVCLVSITVVPVIAWIFGRDLDGIGGFVAACAAPMGVLTGAMVTSKFARKENEG